MLQKLLSRIYPSKPQVNVFLLKKIFKKKLDGFCFFVALLDEGTKIKPSFFALAAVVKRVRRQI